MTIHLVNEMTKLCNEKKNTGRYTSEYLCEFYLNLPSRLGCRAHITTHTHNIQSHTYVHTKRNIVTNTLIIIDSDLVDISISFRNKCIFHLYIEVHIHWPLSENHSVLWFLIYMTFIVELIYSFRWLEKLSVLVGQNHVFPFSSDRQNWLKNCIIRITA